MSQRDLTREPPPRPAWLGRRSADAPAEITEFDTVAGAAPLDGSALGGGFLEHSPPHPRALSPAAGERGVVPEPLTEFLPTDTVGNIPPFPHLLRHPLRAAAWIVRFTFGLVSLVLLLALVAAVPVVNFLALGYLLEAEGRLARTGKLRFMFPLLDLAPRLGSIVLGTWLWLWPLRLLGNLVADASLIDPGGASAATYRAVRAVVGCLIFLHLSLALARGGGFWCFFRPIKNVRWLLRRVREQDYWEAAERGMREFVSGLRLGHHFWLGVRGFVGAAIWLWPPTLLLSALRSTERPGQVLTALLGGLVLVLVFAWVPFLQARFAAENRFGAMFELRSVRELFARAPIAWLLSVLLIYVLALPLYLFKIVLPPQDALWMPTLLFIASVYPARILAGWAYHRAWAKPRRAWFGLRWLSRTLMFPVLAAFVFLLFFTPHISEHGALVLFEHHAFLLPAPLPGILGM